MTDSLSRAQRAAAVALWRVAPFSAVLLAGTCVAAAVLVPVGLWRPAVVWPVLLVVAALAWQLAALVPLRPVPVAPVWTAVVVAAVHGAWAALTHAEHVVLRRDAGSYALYAHWIATRGGLPVDVDLPAFGGVATLADPAFTLDSPAYYQVGTGAGAHVVPQFLVGAPAWFSLGWWVAGWHGLFVMPALASAVAVLAFAALLARLVGPWTAVLAAGVLAASQPVLHAARSTYSEPAALLLVLVAAALAIDALSPRSALGGAADGGPDGGPDGARAGGEAAPRAAVDGDRRLALLAGLLLGVAGLVRVDALREIALLLPVLAVVAVRRSGPVGAVAAGTVAGALASAAAALVLSRPYLRDLSDSLVPLCALTALLALLSAAIVVAARLGWVGRAALMVPGRARRWVLRRLPAVLALSVALAWVVLLTRPWWLTVRDDPASPVSRMVSGFQLAEGLPLVPGKTYAEDTLVWVTWWLGPAAVLGCALTCIGAAHAVGRWWRAGQGWAPAWLLPAAVGLASTALTLWRPGITPDHPWADRRLVPVVLPFVVACAAVALATARASAWPARLDRGPLRRAVVGVLAVGTLGWALSGSLPVVTLRTEQGEPRAVAQVCAGLSPERDVVLAVDPRGYNEWVQVVRGVCGVPAAAVKPAAQDPTPAAIARVATLAGAGGRRVVLLSAEPGTDLQSLGARQTTSVHLHTWEDQRFLERRPMGWSGLRIDVRLAVWTADGQPTDG